MAVAGFTEAGSHSAAALRRALPNTRTQLRAACAAAFLGRLLHCTHCLIAPSFTPSTPTPRTSQLLLSWRQPFMRAAAGPMRSAELWLHQPPQGAVEATPPVNTWLLPLRAALLVAHAGGLPFAARYRPLPPPWCLRCACNAVPASGSAARRLAGRACWTVQQGAQHCCCALLSAAPPAAPPRALRSARSALQPCSNHAPARKTRSS